MVFVVLVEVANILAACVLQAQVAGRALAGVFRGAEQAESGVLFGVFFEQGGGAVGRAVVDQKQFPIGEGLATNGVDGPFESCPTVVNRSNDRDKRRRRCAGHASILLFNGEEYKYRKPGTPISRSSNARIGAILRTVSMPVSLISPIGRLAFPEGGRSRTTSKRKTAISEMSP
jgi:hypothetical protein